MRLAGQADWRPFNGPITLPYLLQPNGLTTLLSSNLGISLANNNSWWNNWITFPASTSLTGYRIYPGGQLYPVVTLPTSCTNQSFLPDTIKNPLGIYFTAGSSSLYQNVTVQGSLITQGNLQLYGPNVTVTPLSLPAIYGSTNPVRLPIAMVQGNFTICPAASGSLDGLVASQGNFEIQSDTQADIQMTMSISVVAYNFLIDARSNWVQNNGFWTSTYNGFTNQGSHPITYFPTYLQNKTTLNPTPALVIQPDPTPAYYTWNNLQNSQNTLFVPGSSDNGCLRWDLLSWTDFP
jgi:hypothetical protein